MFLKIDLILIYYIIIIWDQNVNFKILRLVFLMEFGRSAFFEIDIFVVFYKQSTQFRLIYQENILNLPH